MTDSLNLAAGERAEIQSFTVQQIADTLGLSRPTIYRHRDRDQTQEPVEVHK